MGEGNAEYRQRLREITDVLRLILEDLGPTFIKIGQIMSLHSDILPKKHCDELMRLCSNVSPMPFDDVTAVIDEAYGFSHKEIFSEIDKMPLGAASIAQVHKAVLKNGEKVVIKVQRRGIYETMLARGLTHMEGVLVKIAPDINMVEIASKHMAGILLKEKDIKKLLKHSGRTVYKSLYKMLEIPSLAADILEGYLKGQTRVNMDLHASDDLARLLRRLVRNVVMGLWVMALLISSSIICTTDMKPKIMGIPALGAFGYLVAFCIVMYVFIKHIFSKK